MRVLALLLLAATIVMAGCSSGESNGVATPVDKAAKMDK